MSSATATPPLGAVHRASLEAFRQGDPAFAEYLESKKRIVIIDEQNKVVKNVNKSKN